MVALVKGGEWRAAGGCTGDVGVVMWGFNEPQLMESEVRLRDFLGQLMRRGRAEDFVLHVRDGKTGQSTSAVGKLEQRSCCGH